MMAHGRDLTVGEALDSKIVPTCFGSLPHRSGDPTVPPDVGLDPPPTTP
jgi:hypothetical protein